MKNQAYQMTMLYDFYGDLLTARQKEFFDLYYNEDLSLAEIAENYGITGQGVRDIIVRAEASLNEIEEKTGLIRRFHAMQGAIGRLEDQLDQVEQLNRDEVQSDRLEELCLALRQTAAALRRE